MRTIDEINKYLTAWTKKLKEEKLIKAQRNTAKKVWEDVVSSAPLRSGAYVSSIQIGETVVTKDLISTAIFTDLLVGGDNPRWSRVPLGALLEWGTGIEGFATNTYPHGYGYRLTPWCYYDKYLHMYVTTTGMIARPHFLPSLQKNKQLYKDEIRKALRNK